MIDDALQMVITCADIILNDIDDRSNEQTEILLSLSLLSNRLPKGVDRRLVCQWTDVRCGSISHSITENECLLSQSIVFETYHRITFDHNDSHW